MKRKINGYKHCMKSEKWMNELEDKNLKVICDIHDKEVELSETFAELVYMMNILESELENAPEPETTEQYEYIPTMTKAETRTLINYFNQNQQNRRNGKKVHNPNMMPHIRGQRRKVC